MFRLLIIPLGILAMLAGAVVWSGGGVEKRADFAFINRGDIYTLDINQMSYMQDFRLTYGIREGLYSPDPETLRPIPAGAVGHDLSPDNKIWTFHLRPEARWGNGDPVTAHDYVFSWRRMLEEPGEYTYLFHYIRNAQAYEESCAKGEPIDWKSVGIEAPDDRTFRVTLEDPVPFLLELAAFPPFYPRNEKSMRPFRVFPDTEVFDRLGDYLSAAAKLDPAAPPDALAERFARAVGRPPADLNADAVRTFVAKARGFDLAQADLPAVVDVVRAFAALNPFPKPAEKGAASKLGKMAASGFVRTSYRADYTRPPRHKGDPGVVTNGPFNLTRWDYKRRLVLEKSPTYWDRANVRSNKIEMVVSENVLSEFLLYDTGTVDWVSELLGELPAELKAKGRTDVRTSPAFGTMFLAMLCEPNLPPSVGAGKNPLSEVKVRQALAMAIDKQFIVDNITRMGELPARTYLPPDGTLPDFRWLPGPYDKSRTSDQPYTPEECRQLLKDKVFPAGPGLPYDVDMARRLLAEAGYPNGRGFPPLPILFNTDSPVRNKISETLKAQWKETLGIEVNLQAIEGKIFKERLSKHDFAIATTAWYGDYPDASTFTDKYTPDSIQNEANWKNKTFADLCEKATKEGDAAARVKILSAAENLIDTEVPIVPIYHFQNISLNRDNVHGVLPNPRNLTIFKAVYVDHPGK